MNKITPNFFLLKYDKNKGIKKKRGKKHKRRKKMRGRKKTKKKKKGKPPSFEPTT